MMKAILLALGLWGASAHTTTTSSSPFSCLDETGKSVEWFAGITYEKTYYYLDANTPSSSSSWKLSPNALNDTTKGSLMFTAGTIYANATNRFAFVSWNDQPPTEESVSSTYAHSKGILVTEGGESGTGFLLIHSKPSWPQSSKAGSKINEFPEYTYAQSFVCVSLTATELEDVALALTVNRPFVYDSSTDGITSIPNLLSLISKTKNPNSDTKITKFNNKIFTLFSKSKAWGKDLYSDLISPTLKASLSVETWRDGSGGRLPSFCTKEEFSPVPKSGKVVDFNIWEVNEVLMPDGVGWSGTKDHSKWAVTNTTSTSEGKHVACIGDINRFCSQENRGGGSLCIQSETLWKAMSNIAVGVDGCWDVDVCASDSCYWCESE